MRGVVGVVAAVLVVAGCATSKWEERIGTWAYDDVVREMGPADNCTGLSMGGRTCAWTTSIGRNWIDKAILTFGQDGRLVEGAEKRF